MRTFLLLLLFPTVLLAQDRYMLEGTIGKSAIYMFFDDYTASRDSGDNRIVDMRYYYKSQLRDILMEGTRTGNKFEFFIDRYDDKPTPEKFILTKNGNTLTGAWENDKGKKLPVSLKKINVDAMRQLFPFNPIANLPDIEPQDLVRSFFVSFKRDSVSKIKGKSFEWYGEKHCTSPFFRLGDGFTEAQKKTVNPILERMHCEYAVSQLGCSSRSEYSDGNGIEYTININYVDGNLLGFEVFRSWFCGGAHPDFGGEGYLIDLNSGKQYEIDDILAFDKSVTTEEKSGFDAFVAYRKSHFAPKLFKIIDSDAHFVKPKDEDEDNCDFTDLDVWTFSSWSYSAEGIEFTPHFYRAARNCEEHFLVPFDKLKIFKNPAFPYALGGKK